MFIYMSYFVACNCATKGPTLTLLIWWDENAGWSASAPTCIRIPPYFSRTAPINQFTPKQSNTPTYSRRLLRMNVITFGTYWAIKNFHKVTSSWFNLLKSWKMMCGTSLKKKFHWGLQCWRFIFQTSQVKVRYNRTITISTTDIYPTETSNTGMCGITTFRSTTGNMYEVDRLRLQY